MELQQGTLLHGGTYKIEQVLGQGSFGITYLAIHTALDKKVAIKEFFMKELNGRGEDGSITGMSDGSLSMNYARKFQKEALNLSRLEHPNIVRVTDSFEDNGTFYYVMDYIEGENLNDYIKHNHISRQEAVDIIRDVANALMYMHEEKHMLHLDLKPGNIMRRASDGHIFLIDFGLSKHYSNNGQPETSTTIGLGTAGYAPIEQANQAKNGEFRPTIDVYALGATFYKLLTRETPPAASELVSDNELLANNLKQHNINSKLSCVVVNAMLPSVRMRTQSVKDFLTSLDCNKKVATVDISDAPKHGETNTTTDDTIVPTANDEKKVISNQHKKEETKFKHSSYITKQNNVDTNNVDTEDIFEEEEGIFSFHGRIGRLEYLLSLVCFSLAWLGIVSVCSALFDEQLLLLIGICVSIIYNWIILAQGAKRCHDIGRSGWCQLIPFYGLAMLFCKDEEDNDYGKAHSVGAIKNGKILAVAFVVGLLTLGLAANHDSGEINDTAPYNYVDAETIDTVAADTAIYSY